MATQDTHERTSRPHEVDTLPSQNRPTTPAKASPTEQIPLPFEPVSVARFWGELTHYVGLSHESLRGQYPLSNQAKQAVQVLHAASHGLEQLRRSVSNG